MQINEIYFVQVVDKMKKLYFPEFLHQGIGYIWMKDDEHIWFKFFRSDSDGNPYISSCYRYVIEDIIYTPIEKKWTLF